jgi:iron complex transport system ATP-binding protein
VSASISFENVSVRFGEREILRAVGAEVAAGSLTGIVGPNGAGKTTLLRAALGLLPLSDGTIRIRNISLAKWKRAALARTVAYLPQEGAAKWPLAAFEVAMLGRLPHLPRFSRPSGADMAAVEDALQRSDALHLARMRMDRISSGERARVLMARALATGAKVLLADEPAAFLDPAHQIGVMELLRDEAARGAAVAVTLHDLALACRFCDRLIVLGEGAAVAAGPPEEALSDAVLAEVFGLERNPERTEPIFRRCRSRTRD